MTTGITRYGFTPQGNPGWVGRQRFIPLYLSKKDISEGTKKKKVGICKGKRSLWGQRWEQHDKKGRLHCPPQRPGISLWSINEVIGVFVSSVDI